MLPEYEFQVRTVCSDETTDYSASLNSSFTVTT